MTNKKFITRITRVNTKVNARMQVLKKKKQQTFFSYCVLFVAVIFTLYVIFQQIVLYQLFEELKDLGRQNFYKLHDIALLRENVQAATIALKDATATQTSLVSVVLKSAFVVCFGLGLCYVCYSTSDAPSPLGEALYLYTDVVADFHWRIHTKNNVIQEMYFLPLKGDYPGYVNPHTYIMDILSFGGG